jgi:hypothetical protein
MVTQLCKYTKSHQTVDFKRVTNARQGWIMPLILATQEAEIRRMSLLKLVRANSLQAPNMKKRAGGVA